MGDACFPSWPGPGGYDLARFARLTSVGESASHQVASPTDWQTRIVSWQNAPAD